MKRFRIGKWELRLARKDYWDMHVDMELDFSNFLTTTVKEILEANGCMHGHDCSATPPMFYPEAVLCMVKHHHNQGKLEANWSRAAGDHA